MEKQVELWLGLTSSAGPVAALCCLGRDGMAAWSITESFWHLVIFHMQGKGLGIYNVKCSAAQELPLPYLSTLFTVCTLSTLLGQTVSNFRQAISYSFPSVLSTSVQLYILDGWIDRWNGWDMNRWMDEWVGGWMNGKALKFTQVLYFFNSCSKCAAILIKSFISIETYFCAKFEKKSPYSHSFKSDFRKHN